MRLILGNDTLKMQETQTNFRTMFIRWCIDWNTILGDV